MVVQFVCFTFVSSVLNLIYSKPLVLQYPLCQSVAVLSTKSPNVIFIMLCVVLPSVVIPVVMTPKISHPSRQLLMGLVIANKPCCPDKVPPP